MTLYPEYSMLASPEITKENTKQEMYEKPVFRWNIGLNKYQAWQTKGANVILHSVARSRFYRVRGLIRDAMTVSMCVDEQCDMPYGP